MAIGGVVIILQLAQAQDRTVVLAHFLQFTGLIRRRNRRTRRDHVHVVHSFVVRADIIEALGGANVIVERDTWADDIEDCGAFVA